MEHHSFSRLLLVFSVLALCLGNQGVRCQLSYGYYDSTCPQLYTIVQQHVFAAMRAEMRMGASLLRLHFHDCFVNGCDASILLDGSDGEKFARPNLNSVRGYEVIDAIKADLESNCPEVVSCADIVALAASYGVLFVSSIWPLQPRAHTIGRARCVSFSNRLSNFSETDSVDPTLDASLAESLQSLCAGGDGNQTTALDVSSPDMFDNNYYNNLLVEKGLLSSDQGLFSSPEGVANTKDLVQTYGDDGEQFFYDFVWSMNKMGSIPLTGSEGEIRKNCRVVN
ncbi:hypothetical protein HU200_013712 [Digitaria exilis]|uniref:Peroxidase n=1 Tax=Digitaria exilis TaxID=1010633 RepID=A0A835FD67_9POAL|nr:hypothetical protein HU200_013712 [Digitaria exilis]